MKQKLKTAIKGLALLMAFGATSHAAQSLPGVAAQPASYFFTGKPYDNDLGSYGFAYRNYEPQTNRWTSADPSGFPDGANQFRYAPNPTAELDPDGLILASRSFSNEIYKFSLIIYVLDQGSGVGPIMDQETAQGWGSAIASTWAHTGIDKTNHQQLTFQLSVDLHYVYGPHTPSEVPSNANAVVVEDSDFRSLVYTDSHTGRWSRNASGLIAAHEAGHQMGAPDEYKDVNGKSVPNGGWDHTLMGAGEAPVTKDWNLVLSQLGYTHLFE